MGASITGAISGRTNYLIAGEKLEDGRLVEQGAKYREALVKGTKIIREDQLSEWFRDLIGVGIEELFGESLVGQLFHKSLEMMIEKHNDNSLNS